VLKYDVINNIGTEDYKMKDNEMKENISELRKKVYDTNKRRSEAINRALKTKPFIAAQVYQRYRKCGKPNCKCAKGELHGPFLWIYQKKKGQKVVSTTVSQGKGVQAKERAKRYEKLLSLRRQIREFDQEINKLLNEYESELEEGVNEYVKRKEAKA
jgi:phage host-nuclease inhibitor protein Gam